METIFNFLLTVGFLFAILLFVAFAYARSKQAADRQTEEEKKESEAIAAGAPGTSEGPM